MTNPINTKKRAGIAALLLLGVCCGGFFVVKSQTTLREFVLSADQAKSLNDIDKAIEQLVNQKRSFVAAFALSAGVKSEELSKFKFEKKPDGTYTLIELSDEEIKKAQAEAQGK